jgi:hypothetical protein
MRFKKLGFVLWGVLFLLGAGVHIGNAGQEETKIAEEFTARVFNLGGAVKSGTVYITIERWSTPEERAQLSAAFRQGGQDEVLKVMQKMPKVGIMILPTATFAYTLHYAFQFPAPDGGRNIVIATHREIGPGDELSMILNKDYPFELIQMRLDAKGEGEGKLAFATKIYMTDDGNIAVENYGTTPVQMKNVKSKVKEAK